MCHAGQCAGTPGVEICNGLDDDCDGIVDDNLTDVGGACGSNCPGGLLSNCIGECHAGAIVCTNGAKVCSGSTGPTPEVCDGKDNDCNGVIDDGFGYPNYASDPNNCGACGHVCTLAHATNGCRPDSTGTAECYVVQCNPGFNYAVLQQSSGSCSGGPPGPENGPTGVGCYYTCPVNPPTAETCNGRDDDCDGCADNGLTPPANFCATQGVCAGRVIPVVCLGAPGWKCDYSGVPNVSLDANGNLTAQETQCDGLDNNCNGVVDLDGFPTKGNACTAGLGVCGNSGTIICTSLTTTGCSASPSPWRAVDEQCNGLDDDCDGQVDERTPKAGSTCYNGGAHPCKGWIDPMVRIPLSSPPVYVYQYEASRPDATATSAGGNQTRACSNAGVVPWANVTHAEAQAACAALRDSTGVAMRLCTQPEWQIACEGPPPLLGPPLWSFSIAPEVYQAQICNDINNAATPAVWATGTMGAASATKFCYTDWSSVDATTPNRLYDMSGNLMEWTSTSVTSGGNTYFKAHGGSFTSTQGGTTCEFDSDIFLPTFANDDLGFRCCSDAAP